MEQQPRASGDRVWLWIVGVFAIALVALQVAAQGSWGFHRDEFLYLAMARRVDWGYWSNPPLIGALAWLPENVIGTSLFAVRLLPLAAAIGAMYLTAAIARDLGGRTIATALACVPFVVSPGLLRPASMFQPVMFDILFWTAAAWAVVRYLRTSDARWLAGLGVVVGVGLLNKYSIIFFVIALLAAVVISPHRRQVISRHVLMAIVIAVVLVLPNVLWQAVNGWPVIAHLQELAETQLVNVERVDFLVAQLLIHMPVAVFWILGLVWLFGKRGRQFRIIGSTFVFVILLLLFLRGKAYYTLGAYPMLFAAGAVWLENAKPVVRWSLAALAVVFGLSIAPFSAPLLSVDSMVSYGRAFIERTGIEGPLQWETGVVHELPQDYADMLGWEELAELAVEAYKVAGHPDSTVIYAENYGQAGAIEYYGRERGLPEVYSFADSYRIWAPDTLPASLKWLVYVSEHEGPRVEEMFAVSRIVGSVEVAHARERGSVVYLFTRPDSTFRPFYAGVAERMKSGLSTNR